MISHLENIKYNLVLTGVGLKEITEENYEEGCTHIQWGLRGVYRELARIVKDLDA